MENNIFLLNPFCISHNVTFRASELEFWFGYPRRLSVTRLTEITDTAFIYTNTRIYTCRSFMQWNLMNKNKLLIQEASLISIMLYYLDAYGNLAPISNSKHKIIALKRRLQNNFPKNRQCAILTTMNLCSISCIWRKKSDNEKNSTFGVIDRCSINWSNRRKKSMYMYMVLLAFYKI